jgi:tRNA G10  N-methylase Trm11
MLESVEDHAHALANLSIQPGQVRAVLGDARDLRAASLEDESIDVVVTSPPYSIALDYVKNDEHALEALLIDVPKLRDSMTGVRGRGPKQKLALYNEDMQTVFGEVHRVLKPGCAAAFVIGDATVDGHEHTTTETMTEWAAVAGLNHERTLRKVVFGLYSVMTDEKILIFRKPAGRRAERAREP